MRSAFSGHAVSSGHGGSSGHSGAEAGEGREPAAGLFGAVAEEPAAVRGCWGPGPGRAGRDVATWIWAAGTPASCRTRRFAAHRSNCHCPGPVARSTPGARPPKARPPPRRPRRRPGSGPRRSRARARRPRRRAGCPATAWPRRRTRPLRRPCRASPRARRPARARPGRTARRERSRRPARPARSRDRRWPARRRPARRRRPAGRPGRGPPPRPPWPPRRGPARRRPRPRGAAPSAAAARRRFSSTAAAFVAHVEAQVQARVRAGGDPAAAGRDQHVHAERVEGGPGQHLEAADLAEHRTTWRGARSSRAILAARRRCCGHVAGGVSPRARRTAAGCRRPGRRSRFRSSRGPAVRRTAPGNPETSARPADIWVDPS